MKIHRLYKKFKNILFYSLLGLLNCTISYAFLGYDTFSLFQPDDFRYRHYIFPFPLIAHYLNGKNSTRWADARITKVLSLQDCPKTIQDLLRQKGITTIQCFESYCKPLYPLCNYFVHAAFMPCMVKNVKLTAEVGMYNANNLNSLYGEIGINRLVSQNFSFHDQRYLSGNVARFKIIDFSQSADAWFVSIYNGRAIVVHWFFIPPGNNNIISMPCWNYEPIRPILYPLFSDQWNKNTSLLQPVQHIIKEQPSDIGTILSKPDLIKTDPGFMQTQEYDGYITTLKQLAPYMDLEQIRNSNSEQIQSIIFELASNILKGELLGNFKAWVKDNSEQVNAIIQSSLPYASTATLNSTNFLPPRVLQLLEELHPTNVDEFVDALINHSGCTEEITWILDHTEEVQNWISNH